jgi:hypothetical protein
LKLHQADIIAQGRLHIVLQFFFKLLQEPGDNFSLPRLLRLLWLVLFVFFFPSVASRSKIKLAN